MNKVNSLANLRDLSPLELENPIDGSMHRQNGIHKCHDHSLGKVHRLWKMPAAIRMGYLKKEYFSLNAFSKFDKASLVYLGKPSGRDEDKLASAGLHTLFKDLSTPIIAEAIQAIECKIIYKTSFGQKKFVPEIV